MAFQHYALYPHMTVRDDMAFALSLAKVAKDVIDRQVEREAQILGVAEYLSGSRRDPERPSISRSIRRVCKCSTPAMISGWRRLTAEGHGRVATEQPGRFGAKLR